MFFYSQGLMQFKKNIILISYANKSFYKSQKQLVKSAIKFGIEKSYSFNEHWLKKNENYFYSKNKNHFKHKKGAGYWVWKPFIIKKSLEQLKNNETLIYLDSGIRIIKSLNILFDICEKTERKILVFGTYAYKNINWVKRDVFINLGCDLKSHHNNILTSGGILILKKNNFTLKFINEWLKYSQVLNLIDDSDSRIKHEHNIDFKEHRHDQSILSVLASKYELEIFRSPFQTANNWKLHNFRNKGEFLINQPWINSSFRNKYASNEYLAHNSPYPTLLEVHRTKNKTSISTYIKHKVWEIKSEKKIQSWINP